MNFDKPTDRRGSYSVKWDRTQALYPVGEDFIPMWIADTDFEAPECVRDAARAMVDHGIFGYGFDTDSYLASVVWWAETRHGWSPDPAAIFTVTGLCNGIALVLDTYTDPGDGVVIFSPVYHEFAATIRAGGRRAVEVELPREDGRYVMDLDAAQAALSGDEKILLLCSPHNPVGRVWTSGELAALVDFANRNDLILVSDEVHQDLVYPHATFTPTMRVDGAADNLIVLSAASKTFNIAGMRIGNVIIPNAELRAPFADRMRALKLQPNIIGIAMTTAAYSPEGADWADAQVAYLDRNRAVFEKGVGAIPGLTATPLEATYLGWVDWSGTGMTREEIHRRVMETAGIAPQRGPDFGPGGEKFLRFNFGTQRARVEDAVARLQSAFADLQ
ncbi:MalY/PatB family protein [Ovoidimarina sediminis]|uniref:MalY/PatB family protein n=1 Tax=Ovoidimarina sediminis TaxID=3079856 RepID=UPI00290C252E|nr:PatB family C-S lyase [Rhodophyticola sp. MJ-SS7]MDU8943987.1 PatB family C-S lyase [Rhodophyticola sp. MJ-SS7]